MFRRALTAALVTLAGAAAPASADPVIAGPALPDELAVLATGPVTPINSNLADQVALHRLSTADGAYRGRIAFPADTLTKTRLHGLAAALRRSVDGRFLTFTGLRAAAGAAGQAGEHSTAVRVAADGTWTDQRLGTGWSGIGNQYIGAVTVDGSRTWVSAGGALPLGTLAPGDTVTTRVATGTVAVYSFDLVDGQLHATGPDGVHRLPGGLPTTFGTTPIEPLFAAKRAWDSTFLDTDGVPGVDTAYVTRDSYGLTKYVLSGGTWTPRGTVTGAFRWVAARAVAGAVEVYLSSWDDKRVDKLVDTAEVGAPLKTTGVTTLAYAPGNISFGGLAFAPGSGFPADPAPHPAAPPVITTRNAYAIPASVGATPPASTVIEVSDANMPDVTVTASSSNPAVLPNDKITIPATGTKRTVTFEPVSAGSVTVTFTARSGDDSATATVTLTVVGPAPEASSHYYGGFVDLSAAIDVGGGHFLAASDENNMVNLYKKGVTANPVFGWGQEYAGEADFEGATRFGDTLLWSGSHANSSSGSIREDRRFLAFQTISGSGAETSVEWTGSYTRLWQQWKDWDAANGHGLGANKLKFNTSMVRDVRPVAPNGFGIEGLTMAPGSLTTAWFGMRAPTVTGEDGIERAVILPVNNIDKLTSNTVDAQLGAPIFLDLGGRSIRDISKNDRDEYLIAAGPGESDDSLQSWALYTWDGDVAHDPKLVNILPTDMVNIGAWEGIAEVPSPLAAGSKALLLADSGDTPLGMSGVTYAQYVTLGEPQAGPPVVPGVSVTPKPGAVDVRWDATDRTTRYRVIAKTAAGTHVPGSPKFVTGTSTTFEGMPAGTETTVTVQAENPVTRAAHGGGVKATPTQGARVATTTTLTWEGPKLAGEDYRLVATLSDPNAQGTVQFFNGTLAVTDPKDQIDANPNPVYRSVFPVVNGKAVLNLNDLAGTRNLQARYTSSNPENFLSSQSGTFPFVIDLRPRQPWAELASITGDRVAGGRVAITLKVHGYPRTELAPDGRINAQFGTRVNGSATWTNLPGPNGEANVPIGEDGTVTLSTTALAAGAHRISARVSSNSRYAQMYTDELPVTIAPAGAPAPEVTPIKRTTTVVTTASGPGARTSGQPVTLTARLSDPTATGTVQFQNGSSNLGAAVPVVNGVATTTSSAAGAQLAVLARFEPANDRVTTASAVSPIVSLYRPAATVTLTPATATATTLEVAARSAKVTVVPVGSDEFADRDVYGGVELLDGDRVIGFAPTRRGVATFDVSDLGAGTHTLRARYLSSNALRSAGSESAPQALTVVGAPVGGTVPATLALTLGAPASFAPFIPGVAKEYTAATTANVISTAGDAALTVSEPGHLTNGAFSLAQPLRVELGQSAWTGPVSNESVAIAFKQAIGANDPLRTGTYSKTLTFTLSTTQP